MFGAPAKQTKYIAQEFDTMWNTHTRMAHTPNGKCSKRTTTNLTNHTRYISSSEYNTERRQRAIFRRSHSVFIVLFCFAFFFDSLVRSSMIKTIKIKVFYDFFVSLSGSSVSFASYTHTHTDTFAHSQLLFHLL